MVSGWRGANYTNIDTRDQALLIASQISVCYVIFVVGGDLTPFRTVPAVIVAFVTELITGTELPGQFNDLWPLLLTWSNFNPSMDK